MRTAFIQQLTEEAALHDDIFLIVGDLGYNVVETFRDRFPDRFLNAGIAEQQMTGMAAGLAREGYNVYIYSIANFPTLRCLEQIRNDITYYKGSVKIVAVGAGYAYGSLGMSHHATEEIGIMRTLPNLTVLSPSDPSEARSVATFSAKTPGSMYIRLGKAGEKQVFPADAAPLPPQRLHCLRESSSPNLLIASGSILFDAVNQVEELGVDTAIYSAPFIKPLDDESLALLAEQHPNIIVMEEHQQSCGLGSALIEKWSDLYAQGRLKQFPRVHRIATADCYTSVAGSQAYLRRVNRLYLTAELFEA